MLAPLVLVIALLPSSTAVLAVEGEVSIIAEAQQLRHRLMSGGASVHAESYLRTRLTPYDASRSDDAVAVAESAAALADQLAAEGDLEAAADRLTQALATLARTPRPDEASAALEERLRIQAANWRLGMAGSEETGRGESPQGRAALQLLTEALVRHPTLALDAARYPPRMRRLLEQARVDLSEVGLGELRVASVPTGATVFVDGRPLGRTPLDVTGTLPLGAHRVWLEHEGLRSATRELVLTDDKAVLEIDVVLEASLRAAQPAIAVDASRPMTRERRQRLATLLDAEEVVLLVREADGLTAVRFDGAGVIAATVRATDVDGLAAVMVDGGEASPAPAWVAPDPVASSETTAGAAAAEAEEGSATLLWLGLGGAVAGGVVVAAAVAGVAAVATAVAVSGAGQPPSSGTFTVAVTP
jgi:hypothetical protein